MTIGYFIHYNKYLIQIENLFIEEKIENEDEDINIIVEYIYLDSDERLYFGNCDPINKEYKTNKYKIMSIYDIKNNNIISDVGDLKIDEIYLSEQIYYLSKERAYSEIPLNLLSVIFQNGICENRKTYYSNGLLKEEYFHNNGLIEGIYKKYGQNKKVYEECNYISGKINGIFTRYNSSGEIDSKYLYEDGKYISIQM